MSKHLSRRDFLKLAGLGAAATSILTGCGPASRYVTREPYIKMPEYTYNGLSTYYATTCSECAAACGLVARTMQGRALKLEGNPNNPVNLGKTCARGQAALHGLYNPDRVKNPFKRSARGSDATEALKWDDAIKVVADALTKNQPSEIAFLMGMAPDHLFDLVTDLAKALGAPAPIRFGALGMFEARATLAKAAQEMLGRETMPFFDVGASDFVLSIGANFLETWISPVAWTRGFSKMRKAEKRGSFVQVESRMSQTASKADLWIPAKPGTEGLVALAIGRLAAEAKGVESPIAFAGVDPANVASLADVKMESLEKAALMFAQASAPIAIPGGAALGLNNGLATAKAVLALNAFAGNFGRPGGVYLSAVSPLKDEYHRPASAKEMQDFAASMAGGKIKTLFVHGVNPFFELPASVGFAEASKSVAQIISFATFPDETAMQADYVFPDHHGLESFGYQRAATGSAQSVLSGSQPVVSPYPDFDTRATVDVFLAAAKLAGGKAASALPFADEVEFIQSKISNLIGEVDGFFTAAEINAFTAYFQQHGGWWKTVDGLTSPVPADVLNADVQASEAQFNGGGEFFFVPFVSPTLGEAGANKPWLQELPDPTTTVMWNTWVEMNPETARKLGVEDDDVVKIVSAFGVVEAPVYRYPAIRPDVIAMPFGQGHTAYGQYAAGRGVNPADLLGAEFNEAGDLTFAGVKVTVKPTGKKQPLSRLESIMGVYGVGLGKEG